jgi:glc operon protein GlcG
MAGAAAIAGAGVEEGAEPRVSYWQSQDVTAAFAKGAVLYDGKDRNYMVHASRRDKPGLAEVHTLDTDIIYVLQGSATFVTGGVVEQGKTTEANEIRGDAVRGGETRTIAAGDVVIVPNGTPHWFKDVAGPLTYYVVKVR